MNPEELRELLLIASGLCAYTALCLFVHRLCFAASLADDAMDSFREDGGRNDN